MYVFFGPFLGRHGRSGGWDWGLAELLSALEIFSSKWSRLNLFSLELDEEGFFEFLGFHKRQ
jgi:hypothetical protein